MDDITRPKPTTPAGAPFQPRTPMPGSPFRTPITVNNDEEKTGAPMLSDAPADAPASSDQPAPSTPPMQEPEAPVSSEPEEPTTDTEQPVEPAPASPVNDMAFTAAAQPAPAPTPTPTPTAPATDVTPPTAGPMLDDPAPTAPTFVDPTPPHSDEQKFDAKVSQAPTTSAPKQRGTLAVITVAIVLALGLIAGAGYAYLQNKKDTKKTATPTNAAASKTPAKNPAKTSDVEKASSDLDASLKKVDDTKDYQATDLSDTTLGL